MSFFLESILYFFSIALSKLKQIEGKTDLILHIIFLKLFVEAGKILTNSGKVSVFHLSQPV